MKNENNFAFHQKSYLCMHVFENVKPVLLVSRIDGDWCFLCGDKHPEDPSAYRVVEMGHVLARHPDLHKVMDLLPDEEARRLEVGGPWMRTKLPTVQWY